MAYLTNEMGQTLAVVYRQNLSPILTRTEVERYVVANIIGTQSRQMFDSKTGKLHYVIATYDKVISTTIPIAFGTERKFYLLASFDLGTDYQTIVEDKIMPHIMKNMRFF